MWWCDRYAIYTDKLVHQHDLFLGDVSERGFSAVASGFGRGVLNKTQEVPIA